MVSGDRVWIVPTPRSAMVSSLTSTSLRANLSVSRSRRISVAIGGRVAPAPLQTNLAVTSPACGIAPALEPLLCRSEVELRPTLLFECFREVQGQDCVDPCESRGEATRSYSSPGEATQSPRKWGRKNRMSRRDARRTMALRVCTRCHSPGAPGPQPHGDAGVALRADIAPNPTKLPTLATSRFREAENTL